MRILIDCSNYFLDNKNYGDLAMFVAMARRLTRLWPAADIRLITLDPGLVEQHVPGIRPFVLGQRHHWQLFPPPKAAAAARRSGAWQGKAMRWLPLNLVRRFVPRIQVLERETPDLTPLLQAYRSSDLIMASGGGYFSDMFPQHAQGILDTLEGGLFFGRPAVIMGAGFEEVHDESLLAKARAVLPRLDFIACREGLSAPGVLRNLGVPPERIRVLGDEAIELAHAKRAPRLGGGLGVNLRQAEYSGVNQETAAAIGPTLAVAARQYAAPLVPIPISMFGPSDCESIRGLLADCDGNSDGGQLLDSLPQLLERVSQCRVVVTGSYHAAVFALSQGISVVALARSVHYTTKLNGLRAQFGSGCSIIPLDTPDLQSVLAGAIAKAWAAADDFRSALLSAAREQIARTWEAYRSLAGLVRAR
jgi:polysaccharide pyruvyl transferase WcaK-like protein